MKTRMLKWIPLLALVASGLAHAQTWDGYVEVPAKASEPQRWLTCRKGDEISSKAPPGAPTCVKAGLVDSYQGQAIPMSLQEILDEHFRAPAGYKAVAIGPLPVEDSGLSGVKKNAFYIAYRLERHGF